MYRYSLILEMPSIPSWVLGPANTKGKDGYGYTYFLPTVLACGRLSAG